MGKILSIDLGTMGVKVSVVNFDGTVERSSYHEYTLITHKELFVEQDVKKWWDGIISGVKETIREHDEIEAISICGQMHTHVYIDKNGDILRNAITWMDQRSNEIIDKWSDTGLIDYIFDKTWVKLTTTYTLPQVYWVKKNESDVFSKASHILIAKDYIKYILTGKCVTDPSDASGIGGFDIRNKKWVREIFDILNIPIHLFPEVKPSTSIAGFLSKESARILSLKSGIPVVNGGSDHSISEIGSGMLSEENATCILGTAGVLAACSKDPVKDEKGKIVCWVYPIDGYWDILGITQTAASSLTWFRDTFDYEKENIFEKYTTMAEKVSVGSNGLIFLPYLVGERTPHWDPKAKGVFFGIKISHRKEHFVRSIMEGVAFSMKDCMNVMKKHGIKFESVSLIGGGSKSKVFRKIMADVLGKDIMIPKIKDTSSIGNLIISMLALGVIKNAKDISKLIKKEELIKPDMNNHARYTELFKNYREIYERTKDIMHKL